MKSSDEFIYLNNNLYRKISSHIPIICVDIVPVKQVKKVWKIGIIKRATGKEAGKLAILGGRIALNETIPEAIKRHLFRDLNIHKFNFYQINDTQKPFYVQQYFLGSESRKPYGFDPTKHAIALTYLVTINEEPIPRDEASAFSWIDRNQIPTKPAFNQDTVMQEVFNYLS
ncbi:MAG TPA: DUF4916 domain-containing protein [Candidatus Saccharibacteria bacterium]|nr:DUF4916 domain-containing protein [Candidatus Saccharibacteria bacterium]